MNLVGENGFELIKRMPKGEFTDEEFANTTGILLNVVRRTLFILYENRLAFYRRERDTDSGWLTYLWHIDLKNIDDQLELEAKKLLKNLKAKLEYEDDKVFYVCKKGCLRLVFEDAAELEFICPKCGDELEYYDNEPFIDALKKKISELEKLLSE